jgi:hypothetical protein
MNPIIFKTKELRLRDGGGNFYLERNVIRGSPGEGGEDGARKFFIPSQINENSVKPFKGRGATLVQLSIASIK